MHGDLAVAVVEAVAEVKKTLGHDVVPTWIQLMVSADYDDPSMAPAFALECFVPARRAERSDAAASTEAEGTPMASSDAAADVRREEGEGVAASAASGSVPALIGGVVTGCIGGRGASMEGPSVSITAGVMPGVTAIPFHTEDASLPAQITPAQWGELMNVAGGLRRRDEVPTPPGSEGMTTEGGEGAGGNVGGRPATGGRADETVGMVVLSDPNFAEVDDLLRRMHDLLPQSKLVGGVVHTDGAFFLGPRTIPSRGASGLILKGRFGMEVHNLHSCRPVGPPMTMTRGKEDHVMDLDDRPAGDVLVKLLGRLPEYQSALPVMLGMGVEPTHQGLTDVDAPGGPGGQSRTSHAAGAARWKARHVSGGVRALRGRVVPEEEEATETSTAGESVEEANVGEETEADGGEDDGSKPRQAGRLKKNARIARRVPRDGVLVVIGADGAPKPRDDEPLPQHSDEAMSAMEKMALEAAETSYGEVGAGYVCRDIFPGGREMGGIFIGRHSLIEGATVQIHVKDNDWGREQAKAFLRRLGVASGVEKNATSSPSTPSSPSLGVLSGALMYTCVNGNRLQSSNFREAVPGVPIGGGYMMGELGPAVRGGRGYLHSYTSMVGLFWDRGDGNRDT